MDKTIEVGLLCTNDPNEVTYRITFLGLIKASSETDIHYEYVQNLITYPDVILTQRQLNPNDPQLTSFLKDCKSNGTKLIVFVNDIYPEDGWRLQRWSELADLILTPTELHKQFIQALVDTPVEVMIDAIDYNLEECLPLREPSNVPKICWFGYPESYWKSMHLYHETLKEYVDKGLIDFQLISSTSLDVGFPVIPFNNSTFVETLREFDGCVLSHTPLDYNINTFVKSPNKLVLAITLGVPCITSNTPSYSKILSDTGLPQFKFSEGPSFRKALDNLLSFENRKNYLACSQQYVLNNYTYRKMAEQFKKHVTCILTS